MNSNVTGLYAQFKTDTGLETGGIIVEYGMNSQKKPISFRLARAGGSNSRYTKRLEIRLKPYRRQLQNESMDTKQLEQIVREVTAETVLLGWENVEDENGKPLEFNYENSLKLFTDLPDLYADLQAQSQRSALYRVEVLEGDAKN